MISQGTLQENGFTYRFDRDMEIIKVSKGALIVMRVRRTACNIYNLSRNIVVGDVAIV